MRRANLFVMPMVLLAAVACGGIAWGQENAPRPQLALNAAAPEIVVTTLDGRAMTLAGLRATHPDKVIVLQFGSITDPIFRLHLPTVEKMAAKYADKAVFVVVYQKEAHPDSDPLEVNANAGFNLPEPKTLGKRQKLAQQAADQLHMAAETVVVDAWNDTTSARYGGLPNMAFVVDAKGMLQAGYPFMDPAKVQAAVETLASGKPLPAELRGSLQGNGPAPFDFATAAADMTGGRGPASIAAALERANISDQQKRNLLVAIAEFMAVVQDFRAARGGVAPARGGTAAVPARAGVAGGTVASRPAAPADLQAAQTSLRTSAEHMKTVVRQNMNARDAAALLAALDAMVPAQRLFINP